MKTSAADKYITDETIRRAWALASAGVPPNINVSARVRALFPTREQVLEAGRDALRQHFAAMKR